MVRSGAGVTKGDSGGSVWRVGSAGKEVLAGVQDSVDADGGVQGLVLPQMNADTEQHRQTRQYRPTRTA